MQCAIHPLPSPCRQLHFCQDNNIEWWWGKCSFQIMTRETINRTSSLTSELGRHGSQATQQTAGKPMIITIQWFQEMSGDNNFVKDPLLLVLTWMLRDWRYQNEVMRRGRGLVWILQLAGPPCEHSHYNLESWLGDFYKYCSDGR